MILIIILKISITIFINNDINFLKLNLKKKIKKQNTYQNKINNLDLERGSLVAKIIIRNWRLLRSSERTRKKEKQNNPSNLGVVFIVFFFYFLKLNLKIKIKRFVCFCFLFY